MPVFELSYGGVLRLLRRLGGAKPLNGSLLHGEEKRAVAAALEGANQGQRHWKGAKQGPQPSEACPQLSCLQDLGLQLSRTSREYLEYLRGASTGPQPGVSPVCRRDSDFLSRRDSDCLSRRDSDCLSRRDSDSISGNEVLKRGRHRYTSSRTSLEYLQHALGPLAGLAGQ